MANEIFPNRFDNIDPIEVRFEDDIVNGRRLTSEGIRAKFLAEFEAGKLERDSHAAKKKAAADELIALGVSKESAYLLANYYEEDLAKEEARIKAEFEASKKDK